MAGFPKLDRLALPAPSLALARQLFIEWLEAGARCSSLVHQANAMVSRLLLSGPGADLNGMVLGMPPITAELEEWREIEKMRRHRFQDAVNPLLHIAPSAWYEGIDEDAWLNVADRPLHDELVAAVLKALADRVDRVSD